MTDVPSLGRTLLLVGLALAAVGLLLTVAGRLPFLGRLPGDIAIQRGSWSFYFPVVTCLIISVVLSLVLNLVTRR
ncbi:MAG TPA: DUF2905 domain-containing protein [Chloroflexota bacterium]|nr:DUF2905 domain-containing protein [Chloroflexota bacterium]